MYSFIPESHFTVLSIIMYIYHSLYLVTCIFLTPPLNGALLTNTYQIESSVITFQCGDPGFSLVGTQTTTCNNSGLCDPDPALLECKFIYVSMPQLPVCCILTYRCANNWCMECCCSIWRFCYYSDGTDRTGRRISLSHYHKEKKK